MTYTIRPAAPAAAAFTRRGRPGGASNIHQIQIHATRGPVPMDRQVMATENWFSQQPDRGGWGASADFVVGPDERAGGAVVIVAFGDPIRTFGSWSAGYGSFGATREWGAAEVGLAIEVAQPPRWDGTKYVGGDSDEPFTPETVDAVAWLCIELNKRLVAAGGRPVPATHIDYWDQLRDAPVPRGYLGHVDLANGVKLGKTDPGQMWNWPAFLSKVEGAGVPKLSPPVSNRKAAMSAWGNGVEPLAQTAEHDRYEIKIARTDA